MLKQGRTHTIYPSGEKIILCEIPRGKCPYGNEGKETFYTESNTGEVRVCKSHGLIEKEEPLTVVNDNESKPGVNDLSFKLNI